MSYTSTASVRVQSVDRLNCTVFEMSPLDPVVSQMNPVRTFLPFFIKFHFLIILGLPSGLSHNDFDYDWTRIRYFVDAS
jgi:hypothetical protein